MPPEKLFGQRETEGTASGEEGMHLGGKLAQSGVPFGWREEKGMERDGGGMQREGAFESREGSFG
jgi:hypothetical protein